MIRFFVEDTRFDIAQIKKTPQWLEQVVQRYSQTIDSINYIFCSDEYLLKVNQEYLNHDYFTDIITFDHRDDSHQPLESDIFISVDRVTENASQQNSPFISELVRVMVHGVLHLLGFGDYSEEESTQMRILENQYIDLYFDQYGNH